MRRLICAFVVRIWHVLSWHGSYLKREALSPWPHAENIQARWTKYSGNLQMGRAKRICYLSPMRAAKVQASLRIRAVSPEPPLLAHTSSESRGTFRQKARSLAPLNGWACAVEICHDGMLEDTNSLDAVQISKRCRCRQKFVASMRRK